MNRLTMGEKIVLASSALLVVLSFIPLWATVSLEGIDSRGYSAWAGGDFGVGSQNFFVKLAIILAIAALVVTVLRAMGTALPEMPLSLGLLYVGLGGLATLGLLIGVLTGPGDAGLPSFVEQFGGIDISRGLLLFVGLILALAMTYGGYMHMQSEASSSPTVGGPATPPPPPTA